MQQPTLPAESRHDDEADEGSGHAAQRAAVPKDVTQEVEAGELLIWEFPKIGHPIIAP